MIATGKETQKKIKKCRTSNRPGSSGKKASAKANKRFSQIIFRDWCKACGICIAFCPNGVIGKDDDGGPLIIQPDACSGCRFCELHCPDFAITIVEHDNEPKRHTT